MTDLVFGACHSWQTQHSSITYNSQQNTEKRHQHQNMLSSHSTTGVLGKTLDMGRSNEKLVKWKNLITAHIDGDVSAQVRQSLFDPETVGY